MTSTATPAANYYIVVSTDPDGTEWRSARTVESDAQGDAAALRALGHTARVDVQPR